MVAKRRKAKNPHAVVLGRKGGKVKSEAKTRAARKAVRKRWAMHRAKMTEAK
jgi:hypothetical protein